MSKTWIWVLSTVALVGLVVIILGNYLLNRWEPAIEKKLNEQVIAASDGLYRLSYQSMDLNVLGGNLTLNDAELEIDTTVYNKLRQSNNPPKAYFRGQLQHLNIQGVSLWALLVNKKLNIRRLNVNGLDLQVQQANPASSQKEPSKEESLYEKIKDKLSQVSIRKIHTEDLNVKLIPVDQPSADTLALNRLAFNASDLLVNEHSEKDSSRIFYMKAVDISLPKFDYDIPHSPYTARFDSLSYSSETAEAKLRRVALVPRVQKLDYFKQDKENKALIVLKWDQVVFQQIHAQEFLYNEVIWAERARIKNGSVEFFKDKRYQKDTVLKIGEAPHQQIMKMNQALRIDTVWVDGVDILYQQHSDKYPAEGKIDFVNANGFISNLSNDTTRLQQDRYMRADLTASIMGQGQLHAVFGFDMLSSNGKHSYKGSLGPMQAPAFNKILRPLLNLEIKSGDIQGIQFDMQANDYHHQGDFQFDYSNFGINVLRAPDDAGERSRKGILSFITSNILINDSNPDANGKYHSAKVDYTRVPDYSHFKSIWKSLQEGIIECLGINPKYVPDI